MLWIAGEKDSLFTLDQMRMGASMLGAPLEIMPGLGHAMMLDEGWERVAERTVEWLRKTVGQA